ncbi:hypothetical protein D3C83_223730 [compost metagenome]
MHKKTFSLETGAGLADPQYRIDTYSVEVRDGEVYVELPPAVADTKDTHECPAAGACGAAAAVGS